jgi:hypothetical protein
MQLGTLGTLTLTQIGDGLSKEEIITIKVRHAGMHVYWVAFWRADEA